MSNRYKGGIISATPPTTTGGETGVASGAWTLEQQMQAQAAGNWPIQPPPLYIEDVFSTWLYTGNGSTQTITNGINFSGKGGLLWLKARSTTGEHALFDTIRGTGTLLNTDSTNAARSETGLASFNTDGFSFAGAGSTVAINFNGRTFASWSFREQPKFFDVVTWTGNSTSGRTVAHNLGSAPGCVIIKSTSDAFDWYVYHQSLGAAQFLNLNLTSAATSSEAMFGPGNPAPSSTVITLGNSNATNGTGKTYVAYLFAHNAGGFGLTGTDNVISCGSFTTDGSGNATVNLGYEPQWVLIKRSSGTSDWWVADNMRGFLALPGTDTKILLANTSGEEGTESSLNVNATGFSTTGTFTSSTFIYIAIRRGPMKTPTTGTSVFAPVTQASFNAYSVGFPTDLAMGAIRGGNAINTAFGDRLRGGTQYLVSSSTAAEANDPGGLFYFDLQNSMDQGLSSSSSVFWNFRRAPGFFDEVCYTGNGTAGAAWNHNLGVAPELIIVKQRSTSSGTRNWISYSATTGINQYLYLNTTDAASSLSGVWHTAPTASVFYTNNFAEQNTSGSTYVAYLFASAPGVSKVGSYTGTGSTQVINCGFTGGARFVLIKRTDSTGDWYVWDSARGIVAGNDPYLLLNSTAAEVTNTDFVDTAATGFEISSTAPAAINASGGTFIFLAIA